ncbi:MAG: thiamine-phosphate kinase [Cyanobacteriota bacterium]|nr:thiamine-phosphate kinase [Cyanobacteriota bacterium]
MGETLADLGEWELIRRLGAFAPPGQFADDAAVLNHGGERAGQLVVNTDVLVEGVHFSDATTGPADVGWRAAAANLSDLAAMGCTEVVGLTVALVAPASTSWAWVEGVYEGLHQALAVHGGEILGGDCSGGGQRLLAITALGRLNREGSPIRRGDGRPGDLLVCTGPHGLSRLGLALLQGDIDRAGNADGPGGLRGDLPARAISAHRRPEPRFEAVRTLINCRPQQTDWRVGGCDSSDGLAAAVAAIAAASDCAGRLDRNALPLDPAMAALSEAEAWCLGGGEDFELVLALEPPWAAALLAALPGTTVIGRLETGRAGHLGWSDGSLWPEASSGSNGFQHFG